MIQNFIFLCQGNSLLQVKFLLLTYLCIALSANLNTAFTMIEKGMTGSLVINFFLAAFLKISMKHVWGIIHFLQIVTHMPLLIPILPSNYQVVLKLIYDVARLNIIPQKYIEKVLNWVQDAFKINMGGPSGAKGNSFFVENLGNIFLCITVALILLAFIFLVRFLAMKYEK
jgi:hypothetical protein